MRRSSCGPNNHPRKSGTAAVRVLAVHAGLNNGLTMGIYTHLELGDQAVATGALPGPGEVSER